MNVRINRIIAGAGILLAVFVMTGCTKQEQAQATVEVVGTSFNVDIAETVLKQSKGLSGREELGENEGMYFIFEEEGAHEFWMRDMNFAIDIIWIDSDMNIIDITENALPPEEGQSLSRLPMYAPKKPAKFVLEIPSGRAGDIGLQEGDTAVFTRD